MSHDGGRVVTLTRLGRAVRVTAGGTGEAAPRHREEHRQANWLRDVILAARTAWSTSSGSSWA